MSLSTDTETKTWNSSNWNEALNFWKILFIQLSFIHFQDFSDTHTHTHK